MMLFLILIINLVMLLLLVQLFRSNRHAPHPGKGTVFVVDTSSLIDGRLSQIINTGFMHGRFLVIEPVLAELHHIADSKDELRRNRGRGGLETVRKLQASHDIAVEVIGDEAANIAAVDDKLVAIALKHQAAIITGDYNLNRVATIKGVRVLNVNELARALRPQILPGEKVKLKLVTAGSERAQAVGYLEDGTMVVVEGGRSSIGSEVEVELNNIMQTQAGRMMFARLISSAKG